MIGRLSVAFLLCAEAIALYALAELIANGYTDDRHAVAAWALLASMLAAYLLPRLAGSIFVSERNATIALTVAAVVILYALLRVEFAHDVAIWDFGWVADFLRTPADTLNAGSHALIGFIFLLTAWLWGAYRSNTELEPELVGRAAAVPFIVVTVIVVIGAATDRSGEIGRAAIAFFVLDVLALVLSQLSLSGASIGSMRSGSVAGMLLLGTGVAVLVGIVVITFLFAVVQPALGPTIGAGVDHLLAWVLTPFAWVFEKIFALLFRGNALPELPPTALPPSTSTDGESSTSGAELVGLYVLRGLAVLVLVAAVAGVIALVVRLRRRQVTQSAAPTQVFASGSIGEDLGDLMRRMFRRGPRSSADSGGDPAVRLYFEVLQTAAHRGSVRPPATTPAEFAGPLKQTFPGAATDEITRAFEAARYAGRPLDENAVQALRDRWQQAR